MIEKLNNISTLPVEQDENAGAKESQVPVKKKMGRPPGSKNKDTIFKELMNEDFQALATTEVKKVFQVLFEKAQEGEIQAIKLVLDRVVPVTKAVDLADMEKRGLTISINVGNLEENVVDGIVVEEGEFEEVDADASEVEEEEHEG